MKTISRRSKPLSLPLNMMMVEILAAFRKPISYLLGVSRTSKTPLSMYLAHKRLKVANVPLVPEMQPPAAIYTVPKDKIIGLRIDPDKLNVIRQERLRTLGLAENATYANVERIKIELDFADKIMSKIGCVIFDVSNRAVEETASLIMDHIEHI
jgi:regulator of PEP synthase PpsR (kinase-PPPase family)